MQTEAIKVEIDPAVMLPNRRVGTDEDGYATWGEVSLYDAIVDAAATQVVESSTRDLREKVAAEIESRINAMLDEALPSIFKGALNETVDVSDEWGRATKSKTLRQIIAEHAKQEMRVRGDRYGNLTTMEKVIREQVESSLHKLLSEDVAAAKAQIKARLTAKAAELLATETLREAGIR